MDKKTVLRPPSSKQSRIYHREEVFSPFQQPGRYTAFCVWAEANDFNPIEYLLPVIEVDETIGPYTFEKKATTAPTQAEIDAMWPWLYQIEWPGGVSTLKERAKHEWYVHHHRTATLCEFAEQLYGADRAQASVLDVGCHSGVFTLEFASRGFKSARGVDLRDENVAQGKFLAKAFNVPNAEFAMLNARDIRTEQPADVVFCGGLLYHVTFPHELIQDLAAITKDILIFDTLCQKHPFSGFHYIGHKDTGITLEGDTIVEFMPTYRGVIDLLQTAGFTQLYELVGSQKGDIAFYQANNIRSFVAARDSARLKAFIEKLPRAKELR